MGGESSKAMSIAFKSCREVKVLSGNITGKDLGFRILDC